MSKKVAIVYDRVNKWGGAERVLLALKKIYPDAELFTSVYNPENAKWADVFKVNTSFLQNFPKARTSHQLYATLMPLAFESFSFEEYDLVISVTSEAAKGIITKPQTFHLCYCLTPTRYLWSGYKDYFRNPWLRFFSKPVVSYLRFWDQVAAQRPDEIVAISKDVQKRIKKYYQRDSKIIHPPLMLEDKILEQKPETKNSKTEEYYLLVSRLELVSYKKVDIAIKAFNKLGLKLKIVGTGSGERALKKIAGPNIEFLGKLTDEKLSYYYKNCKALVFPGLEDFGLVMIEAQAFGKPVVAFRGGGALDIIKEGVTGEFFDEQNPESLKEVLEKFQTRDYNSKLCAQNSERFSFSRFENELENLLKDRKIL